MSQCVKLAMDMSSVISEEETRRQQEIRVRLEREERAKARGQFCQELGASTRNIFVFLLGAAAVLFVVLNSGHFQDLYGRASQRLTAEVNAHSNHSVIKQDALDYQKAVDEITK